MGNFFVKDEANRVDPYIDIPRKEPSNCNKLGVVPGAPDQRKEAIKWVDKNTKQHCCTLVGSQVTQWYLSSPSSETNKVKLMTAESGITFVCHKDLKLEGD